MKFALSYIYAHSHHEKIPTFNSIYCEKDYKGFFFLKNYKDHLHYIYSLK